MEKKWRIRLTMIGVVSAVVAFALVIFYSQQRAVLFYPSRQQASTLPGHMDMQNIAEQTTEEKIVVLAKIINNANKHVRGSKTAGYLKDALSVMKVILKEMEVDMEGLFERPSVKSENICPETYKGGAFGFPLYYQGFEVDHCNYSVPVSSLVTVIKYFDMRRNGLKSAPDHIERFLSSVFKTIDSVRVLIAVNHGSVNNVLKKKYPYVNIIQAKYKNEGFALNSLVQQVKTPYVLIAKDTDFFTNDSRLERLVRELESLNVVAVGGAFRYPNGHWHKGCYQSVYRNYTLQYISGYDESFHECLFCDFIQGPFLTATKYLRSNLFGDFNENSGLYEDWFLGMFQRGEEAVVCPDSMFHLKSLAEDISVIMLKEFMQTWDVFKMITPKGQTVTRECENQDTQSRKSFALSPCALKLNTAAVKFIMSACEEVDLNCELQEGTAIGAIKFGKSLPWELDYDIRFSLTNCSRCKLLEKVFVKSGIKFEPFAFECCTKTPKLGYRSNFKVTINGYKGDFTGHPVLDSEQQVEAGIVPTKVLYDGQWVNFARNPGLYVRNRYGKEIYRHAEHWLYTGGYKANHRINYTTNVFLQCQTPGVHNCLDRYNADGNLPFVDLLP